MTVDELMATLLERNAALAVEDGCLRYHGPVLTATDPVCVAIREHRGELVALFTRSAPVACLAGWSGRLQREVLEPVPGRADQWQETAASSALCIHCSEPLVDDDLLRCLAHIAEHGIATPRASGLGRAPVRPAEGACSMIRPTFPERLALARLMIARGAAPAPTHVTHVADQIRAAGSEVRGMHDRMATVLPLLEPDRCWYQRLDADPSDDVRAYLLAALLGCVNTCPHLRKGGPQPGIARLPLRRIACSRCSQTLRRPSPEDDDRCDVCAQRGISLFFPFALRSGPLLVAGDACAGCAHILGIGQEKAS